MGKEKFLKRFNDLKKIIIDSTDKVDLKKYQDLISSCYIEQHIFSKFANTVINKKGPKGFFDGVIETSRKSGDFAKKTVGSIIYQIDNNYKELKDDIDKLFNNKKLNDVDKIKATFDYMFKEPGSKTKDKFIDSFIGIMKANFSISKSKYNFENVEAFMEGCNLDNKDYPDVSEMTSAYETPEKGLKPALNKEINEYIKQEGDKEEPDYELIDSLSLSNKILLDITDDSGFLSEMAESQGKMAEKVFDIEYEKYQEKNKVQFVEKVVINSPEMLVSYCKNNLIGQVKYDEKFKSILSKCADTLIEKDYVVDGLSKIFMDDTDKLEKAIKEKNVKNIKDLSKKISTKIKDVDKMIVELKSIDDKHMFNSNFASTRESYYPGKYRIDYEGATLVNHALLVARICKKYDVKPSELLNDPIKVVNSIYKNHVSSKDANLIKFVQDKNLDIFTKINTMYKEENEYFLDIKDKDSKINNEFIQLGPVLSVNNPTNRYETYHKITSEIRTTMQLADNNLEAIGVGFYTDAIFLDAFPKMVMMGDDFVPQLHFNCEGLCDLDTKDYRKPYDLQDYMKNMSLDDIFMKLKKTYSELNLHKDDKNYNKFVESINSLETEVVKSFNARGINDKITKQIINLAKINKLTPMQTNTLNAAFDFASKGKDENEIYENKIKALAELERKYNSHNIFAQVFFPKLRAQNNLIKEMKAFLIESGHTKEEINSAIKAINEPEKVKPKDDNKEKEESQAGQEKEEPQAGQEKKEPQAGQENKNDQKYVDPRGYTIYNISEKMAELDDLLGDYCLKGNKNTKNKLLKLGVDPADLDDLKELYKSDKRKLYTYTKTILDKIESDFYEKDEVNSTSSIVDTDFNKPDIKENVDYETNNKNIEINLHMDSLEHNEQKVKFDESNSNRSKDDPDFNKELNYYNQILELGGVDITQYPDLSAKAVFNNLSRRQQNEFLKKYYKERGVEKYFDPIKLSPFEVIRMKQAGIEFQKKELEKKTKELEKNIKENYINSVKIAESHEYDNKEYTEEDHLKFEKENEKIRKNINQFVRQKISDHYELKASRNVELNKLYKKDNPSITNDEILLRGKLAKDEIASDMEVKDIKKLVDKRFELFNLRKENTEKTDYELVSDVIHEGNDIKYVEKLIKQAGRIAQLNMYYKHDNPNITNDEIRIREKLAQDEPASDMDINSLKKLVDKRFELFTIGKENTDETINELIYDVLIQGNNINKIEKLVNEAKEELKDAKKIVIDDKAFEECGPQDNTLSINENEVPVKEEELSNGK